MASASAFQAEDEGSIPFTRSNKLNVYSWVETLSVLQVRNDNRIVVNTQSPLDKSKKGHNWAIGQTVKMSACHAVRSGFNSRNARKHANYYLGEYSNWGMRDVDNRPFDSVVRIFMHQENPHSTVPGVT